jgi:hypothetical protein
MTWPQRIGRKRIDTYLLPISSKVKFQLQIYIMLNITFVCELYSLLDFLYNLKTKYIIHWADHYPIHFHSSSILSSISTYPFILQPNLSCLIKILLY